MNFDLYQRAEAILKRIFLNMAGLTERNVVTTFPDREHGFEAKFAIDEELKFKATARRNRLIGHWAAEKLKLAGPAADAYANDIVNADLESPGTDAVLKKIRADFDAHNVVQSDHQIRRTMDDLMAKVLADLKANG